MRVDGGQFGSKLFQHGDGGRLIVDEHPALATGGNLAAQNELLSAAINSIGLEQAGSRFAGCFEDA